MYLLYYRFENVPNESFAHFKSTPRLLQATQYMEIVEIDFGILGIIRGLDSVVL